MSKTHRPDLGADVYEETYEVAVGRCVRWRWGTPPSNEVTASRARISIDLFENGADEQPTTNRVIAEARKIREAMRASKAAVRR